MWCEKLPSGKVRYAERYLNPLTMKQEKVSVTMDKDTKSNRKLAQDALQSKIDSIISKLTVEVKKEDIRLSELVELYLDYQHSTLEASTYKRNLFAMKSLMHILGKDTVVDRLTAGYVRRCLADQNEKACTSNERIKRLKAMIRWGYNNDYIQDIRWLDKLTLFKDDEKRAKLEDKFLESSELAVLLDNMSVDKWRFLAKLTALSGLRCGEAIALEQKDVDFDNRIIHVTKTYDSINEIVSTPKTMTSYRDVYMQDELLSLCKLIHSYMQREQLMCNYRTSLFISDVNGNHLDYYAYNKYLGEVSIKTIGKKVTSHFMRHTHVSLMAEQGIPFDVIARRLGHTDSKITKQIYFHVTEKLKEKDNDTIKNVKLL